MPQPFKTSTSVSDGSLARFGVYQGATTRDKAKALEAIGNMERRVNTLMDLVDPESVLIFKELQENSAKDSVEIEKLYIENRKLRKSLDLRQKVGKTKIITRRVQKQSDVLELKILRKHLKSAEERVKLLGVDLQSARDKYEHMLVLVGVASEVYTQMGRRNIWLAVLDELGTTLRKLGQSI